MISDFIFTTSFLEWLPKIFFGIILILAAIHYVRQSRGLPTSTKIAYKKLIIYTLLFYAAFGILLTYGQYWIWDQTEFTRIFLSSPLEREALEPIFKSFFWMFDHKLGYFMNYVLGRFWLELFISVGLAYFFYALLRLVRRHREEFFLEGETELGLLAALTAMWPNFVIFLPAVFLLVILFSIFRQVWYKESFTTLGYPFLVAGFITLLLGDFLIKILNLTFLKV
jgi:hypothetical protein